MDLLDGLRLTGRYPPSLHLVGMVPETTALGVDLSSSVAKRMDELIRRLAERIGSLGFAVAPIPAPTGAGHEDLPGQGPMGRRRAPVGV